MKRLFWVALGATAGVLVVRQIRSTAAQLTPAAVAGGVSAQLKGFWADVVEAMGEREAELRAATGLDGSADTIDAHTLRRP